VATVSLEEYKKALEALDTAMRLTQEAPDGEPYKLFRDGSIQRFEFCVELAWKVSKKIMGSASAAPKTIIREMAQDGLIQDPVQWIDFIEARNKSSHTYDEKIAEEVFEVVKKFPPEGEKLLHALKSR